METEAYLAVKADAMLLIMDEDKSIRRVSLYKKVRWSFGRDTETKHPDIAVRSKIVSREHGEFGCVDGEWFYIDKGSKNGTFYNGRKLTPGNQNKKYPVMLSHGDILRVDHKDFDHPDNRGVWMMFLTEQFNGIWRNYEITKPLTVIGRDASCDIVLPEPYISARHCVLEKSFDGISIHDADSTAGTWLNGSLLRERVRLREKDTLSICNRHFVFTGNSLVYNDISAAKQDRAHDNRRESLLKVNIERKSVRNLNGPGRIDLLRQIRLEIISGELIAVLGSAGAGKSTFMDCINGMNTEGIEGSIQFCGEDLIRNFDRLKYLIGSVPQFSTFHPNLTVEKELMLAAEKRLPKDMSKQEIRERLDRLIAQLGIEAKRKTQIRKCSGGEQRRVNIAMDLIAVKLLYCLDEPDAGLDPNSKKELFTFLRSMAHEEDRTILTIIHDVSEISLFDKVIILGKKDNVGRLAFYGSPEEAERHFGGSIRDAYKQLSDDPDRYIQ
ncbi:MAG: FHA domain-containing protein [Lachnospiraceae bacterium]|nr:FHA domain-containing protein [Lachnospiraceae bacterium]